MAFEYETSFQFRWDLVNSHYQEVIIAGFCRIIVGDVPASFINNLDSCNGQDHLHETDAVPISTS